MRGRAAKWIFPTIGDKDMRAVTREDIEAIVRRLDAAIVAWQKHEGVRGEGRMSPSTAKNVWGDLQHAFDEAVRAKDPGLRVLSISPCANVRGPESGNDREGPILYSGRARGAHRRNISWAKSTSPAVSAASSERRAIV
jgi:hypothetical protein